MVFQTYATEIETSFSYQIIQSLSYYHRTFLVLISGLDCTVDSLLNDVRLTANLAARNNKDQYLVHCK